MEKEGIFIKRNQIKRFMIGRPLDNEALDAEKYAVGGAAIISRDAISSVAYAGQEMLASRFRPSATWIRGNYVLSGVIISVVVSMRPTGRP
jgi:hypothetical protein